jgi:hypothetical protein
MAGTNTWAQLSLGDQDRVLAYMPIFRGLFVQFASFLDASAKADDTWKNGISAPVNTLATGTVIPDATGLAGAQALTMDQLVSLMSAIETFLATYNTAGNRALYQLIVGPVNM